MASPTRHPARDPERLVRKRVEAVLPTGARAYANVRWLAPARPGGPARDGEIDLLLVRPEHGLFVIETKGGSLGRDRFGRWYAGHRALEVSPFQSWPH